MFGNVAESPSKAAVHSKNTTSAAVQRPKQFQRHSSLKERPWHRCPAKRFPFHWANGGCTDRWFYFKKFKASAQHHMHNLNSKGKLKTVTFWKVWTSKFFVRPDHPRQLIHVSMLWEFKYKLELAVMLSLLQIPILNRSGKEAWSLQILVFFRVLLK